MLSIYKTYQGYIVLFAIGLAFALGVLVPHLFTHLTFISDSFINLLRMCALPIVATSLIVTIGSLEQIAKLKTIARNSMIFILMNEIIAVSIGLVLFNVVKINSGISASLLASNSTSNIENASPISIAHVFNYLFTSNIFNSLVKFDTLPIVIFSIMFGITCALNNEKAKPSLDFLASVREIFLELLNGVMYLSPIAIFVMIGTSVSESYLDGALSSNLLGLLKFVGLFLSGLLLHFLWQIIAVVILYRDLSFRKLLQEGNPIFVTAFVSSSSLATLPLALKQAKTWGANSKVVDFMLPICASMNFASGMMYEMGAVLFFMDIMGFHPDFITQLLLAITCIITGIAVGGIPETSMVSFVTIFNMAGIPLSAIAILMPLDRILDRIRTMVNIFGNTCGTLVVSKTIKN